MRNQQVRDDRIERRELGCPFRERELETSRVVEGVPRQGHKPPVPHQVRIEGRVRRGWSPPLVAGTGTISPYDIVVLDADSNRLAVAKSV